MRYVFDVILISYIKLIKHRYLSLPKIKAYKRKQLPQRNVDESDELFYHSPLAYQNDIGSVFLNHSSKYNTKKLKPPRGKKVYRTCYN